MRYIDADALYKKLYPLDLADKRKYTINAKAVADAIANIPTADVVPRSEVALKVIEEFSERLKPYENRNVCTPCNYCKNSLNGNRNKRCDEYLNCLGFDKWESIIEQIASELKKKYTEGGAE